MLTEEEIRQRIAGFKKWHYGFEFRGNVLPPEEKHKSVRLGRRKELFFDPVVELYGGSLVGKRVLDLACNAGFWSLSAAHAGCDYVLGIEGRQMHVDQANLVFEAEGVDRDRYDFVASDIYEADFTRYGEFDVVMCLGLMYHVSKHIELLEKISEVNTDILIVDTTVSLLPGSVLEIDRQNVNNDLSAFDYNLAMQPTKQAMRKMIKLFGYSVATLVADFRDENGEPSWERTRDYKRGNARKAFVCSKKTDLSALPAEVEGPGPARPTGEPG